MTSQEIIDAIFFLVPDSEFSFTETDLSTLKWDSTDIEQPSDKDIIAAIPLAKKAKEAEQKEKAAAKAAILAKLGLTQNEVTALLA
jgi:hypothetical protein